MIVGLKIIWGVPEEIKPIVPTPQGKVRFRFRNKSFGRVYIKSGNIISEYALIDNGESWGLLPQGKNIR